MNKLLAIIERGCAKYRDLSVASRSIDLRDKPRYFCFGKLREAWFHLRMSKILFAAKQSWTTLRMSRPLFVDSYLTVTWNNKHMSWKFTTLELSLVLEPPSPTQALGVNPFPSRFIIRTVPRGDLRAPTVGRANHNDEMTLLLYFTKQQEIWCWQA